MYRSDGVVLFLRIRSFRVRSGDNCDKSSVQMVVPAWWILTLGDEILDLKPGMASDVGDMEVFPVEGLVVVKILSRRLDMSDDDALILCNSA